MNECELFSGSVSYVVSENDFKNQKKKDVESSEWAIYLNDSGVLCCFY